MKQKKVDNIDKLILSILTKNARTSLLDIAKKCGLSGAAIHQRVKALEKNGVIQGYSIKIKPETLGVNTVAYIGIRLSTGFVYESVIKELKKLPQIVETHFVTGDFSFILKVVCKSKEEFKKLIIDRLNSIEGVESTTTYVSLESIIDKYIDIE